MNSVLFIQEVSTFLGELQGYLKPKVRDKHYIAQLRLKHAHWLHSFNTSGLGYGIVPGHENAHIKVYVRKKADLYIKKIPNILQHPRYGQIPVTVMNATTAYSQRYDYWSRPVRPGLSTSQKRNLRGTICARVTRTVGKRQGQAFVLSCQHVFFPGFDRNDSSPFIVQPAQRSRRPSRDHHLIARQYLHAKIKSHGVNEVDAAIGLMKLSEQTLMTNQLIESEYRIRGIDTQPAPGDAIEVYGAVSGKSIGRIEDVYNSEPIIYETGNAQKEVRFFNIIKCRYSNIKGDSGAPVLLTRNKKLIGMHFAGDGQIGYVCRIAKVFSSLNIQLQNEALI